MSEQSVTSASEAPAVLSEREGALALITLNRPERLNALSSPVMNLLVSALREAANDHGVRAVLLRASGRAFCAGGDLKSGGSSKEDATRPSMEERAARLRRQMDSAALMHMMAKPTVVALRGAVMGAGVGLGLSADIRLGSTSLKLETSFRNLAFSGDFGGSYFLTRLAGASAARDLMLRSTRIGGAEALRLGLINELLEDDALDDRALAVARELAAGPTIAFHHMKLALNAAADGVALAKILDQEASAMVRSSQTDDHREAVRAFIEKRSPTFNGR